MRKALHNEGKIIAEELHLIIVSSSGVMDLQPQMS